jgi:hypothetical protein
MVINPFQALINPGILYSQSTIVHQVSYNPKKGLLDFNSYFLS